ncbi:MAG: ABC transporter ATP-binding protein [Chloroflexi bacterium]|nr:ABC transporter ATP-binding protein [Chloroflexota bacterium]MBI4505810.1 ABC transporter ATP-binding protein [Chloroflexota bacterium]
MLVADGVSRRFGGLQALADVSFTVAQGAVTAIIGPNGAGKTTLFNVVSGILKPSGGRVLFEGTDVTGWPPQRIVALGAARTFQNIQLFRSLNVVENVMVARYCRSRSGVLDAIFGLRQDREDRRRMLEVADHWLGWVGIGDKSALMPSELPYGDQRRLEIARALATEPRLIMLDEPTAGMTAVEAQELMALVRRLTEIGKTILLIEHNMNVVMAVSDRIIVLNFGEKIAEGTPEEIRAHPQVIEAYLGSEA